MDINVIGKKYLDSLMKKKIIIIIIIMRIILLKKGKNVNV